MPPNLLNNALAFIGKKFDELIAVSKTARLQLDLGESTKQLDTAAKSLETVAKTLASQKNVDHQQLNQQVLDGLVQVTRAIGGIHIPDSSREVMMGLQAVQNAVENIHIPSSQVNLGPVVTELVNLQALLAQRTDHSAVISRLEALADSLNGFQQRFKMDMPGTIKLDPDQLREIVGTNKYGGVNGGQLAARTPTMENTSMASANTEYSYTFPANTVSYFIKLRSQNVLAYYSWATGTLPGSGDASSYATVPQNGLSSRPNVDFSSKTIYFESASASQVMEIESFQL